jgi:beta-lactamase superfamily II metal-dependent hydrolase
MLSEKPDKSVTNASSISFIINACGKRLLFLADATEEAVLGIIEKMPDAYFDIVKLSHHGSLRNASNLFTKIDGEFFFVSTDGSKHNHPHLATIAKIIHRPSKITRKLVFNYPHKAYHFFNDEQLQKTYNYSAILVSEGEEIIIA